MQLDGITRLALSVAIVAALASGAAFAQDNTGKNTQDPANSLEEVVVTGSASAGGVKKIDASYSITTASQQQILDAAPSSTADLLKIVPGVWAEASGGSTGANIYVRGFPGTGDAPYVTMELDGSPLYPSATLSFLENSTLFRIDDTVQRVEVLRGGPSPIFSNGQPGITVNFIQKTGMETPEGEGSGRLTAGTDSFYRVDGHYGGQVGENWYLSVGGFYRRGDGVHDTQYPANDGGQVSLNLTRAFDGGTFSLYGRRLDDRNAFFTAMPLVAKGGDDVGRFPGFDAGSDTLYGNDLRHLNFQVSPGATPGTISRDVADGRGTDISLFGSTLDLRRDGWSFSNRAQFVNGDTPTVALFTGTNPTSLGAYINSAVTSANGNAAIVGAGGQATGGTATYANGGQAITDLDRQVIEAGMWVVDKHIRSFTDEARFGVELFPGNTLTVGTYFASYSAEDHWYLGNNMLMTVENNARLIDVALDNGAIVSQRGFSGAPFFALNADWDGRNSAAFVSDEWETGAWRFDAGVRFERKTVDGTIENASNRDLDNNPLTVFNNNASVANGTYRYVDYEDDDVSWTAGANYTINDHASMFARVNSGVLFPSFDDLRDGNTQTQTVDQYELGFKAEDRLYSLYLTAFANRFDGVPYQQFDQNGNNIVSIGGAKAHGIEFEAALRPVDNLELAVTGNWTDAEYKDYGQYTGNRVQRQPKFQYRFTPRYTIPTGWGDVKLFGTYTHVGDRVGDLANAQPLPSYYTIDVGAEANVGEHWNFRFTGTNITNQIGLTEGNARIQGSSVTGNVFLGRAIFARSYMFSAAYYF